MTEPGFETLAIHAGQDADAETGAVVPPIYQVSTYLQDAVGKPRGGHDYARTINPTRTALERCLAALEGAEHGFAFASGMAATDTVLRAMCVTGDHVVIPDDAYGGTFRLVDKVLAPWGLEHTPVAMSDLEALAAALRPGTTRIVWVETPTNPMLRICDLSAAAELAHRAGAILVVDNTFATPYLQRPLALGADVIVHSTTKYLGGHSDVVGGAALTSDAGIAARLGVHQNSMGAIPGPFDAWLVLRGVRTLALRMERHCDNAEAVVALLVAHPMVTEVLYPGLDAHPGHAVAARQMRRYGGMVSFRVAGGREAAVEVCNRARLFTLGESLGGVESLIELPKEMTHQSVEGSALEVPADLVRLSVGIESIGDLAADLAAALG
ncbi:MAG TPA: cystathionine gamma-synthase [Acidimicrobiales bacterium]|nr:cystathionine gamma-synthase [Acidimicrobiales bacterium]